jgi:amino acid adenylation domain-containing protein
MPSPRKQGYFPASANQRRMFVLNQLSPDGTEYNVPVALRLTGKLDVDRLRKALSALAARHASLRASFEIVDEQVVQKIEKQIQIPLPRRRAKDKADVEEIKKNFVRPFDLRHAPLFRPCLIGMSKTEHVLLLDLHHIICDGVSVDILIEDLGRLYDGQALKKTPGEYHDFALWQKGFAATAEAKKQEEYWLNLLGGERPTLNLPMDFPRERFQSFDGDRVFTRPNKDLCAALRALAAKNRVSLYMLLLSAYNVLLSKYSGQEDIIVGTLAAGRREEKFRDVVGLFVNTLLLRSQPRGELEFAAYLKQVRGECLSAYENQDYQFEDLVDRISPTRDLGRNPLFDTMFEALSCDERVARYGDVGFSRYELDYTISKFDLSLTLIEQRDQEVVLEFEYCTHLFRKETIERLSLHYLNLLKEVVANPRVKLSDIDMLTAEEKSRLVAPQLLQVEKAAGASVVDLFQAQVRKNPGAPAVAFRDEKLNYGDLDRRSNELAARLREQGVARGNLVGLVAAPSVEMIIAILSILKLGAAYLPIDPTTPVERFRNIVADSGIATLLVRGVAQRFVSPNLTIVSLDEVVHSAEENFSVLSPVVSDDLAYVIYTSGSTGTPKGVMVSHGALANYITWATKTYINEEEMSFALHSSLSVDLTVTSIFVPLVSGNRIVIYRSDDAMGLIGEIVRDNQVQLIKLTPTHLSILAEVVRDVDQEASKLRTIIVGGEDLKTSLAAKICASYGGRVAIFNEYGPTEATVGCMIHKYDPATDTALSVPIGKAIDNTGIYILDKYNNPVPEGVTGELCIGGICLAAGYLKNSRLTSERFVANRLGSEIVRMYKTGDVARMLPNGKIEYLGRNDDQVKVRGFRIELGEIEANLLRLPQVKEAVVTKGVDATGDSYLCAYVVTEGKVSMADLRARLAERLPEYMIPAWFVPLDRFPVGRGGKLDKGALPDPRERVVSVRAYAPPRSRAEAGMTKIWQQVLGIPRVGIDDNFFELGGQSLKATLMAARVNRELHANVTLREVFAHPVIRELAALVEETVEDLATAIKPVAEQEYYPVSSAQKRLFILNRLAPLDVLYNVPWAVEIKGQFEVGRWRQAFCALIARHESLRTSFALIDDEIVQKVHPAVEFAFECSPSKAALDLQKEDFQKEDFQKEDLQKMDLQQVDIQQEITRFIRPFDLSKAPLIRATIVETGFSAHTLIIDMHHIVADGISAGIILEELCALYGGQTLEAPTVQYKDYAAWQRAYSSTAMVQAQGGYWRKLFEGELPVLNLPADFPRAATPSFDGDLVTFKIDAATVSSLRAINRECGTTMHMTLLAAYTILLSKYSDQEDIVVGTPVAGRNHALVQRVVGMFVNMLAMRNQPKGELTFYEFLRQVKSNALDAYSNQEYQFEELVDKLEIERTLTRNPLFDTVFACLDDGNKKREIDGLSAELLDFEWKISKFDLTLLATERKEEIDCELEYCTKLFRRSTIERFASHYKHILEQIGRNPETRIADIQPLTEVQRQQILVEFNQTEHGYPSDRSIHEIFEEQADKNPDNVAVVFGETSLSYLQLNQRANQIARILVGHGVTHEEIVGIMAAPSVEMIVGVLGILKAGCAYLPIDEDCPDHRALAMLQNSGARIVLKAGCEWQDETRLVLDISDSGLYQGDDSNLGQAVGSHDLAYVIYTSGTTGAPKGVMIEHHSVNNLCAWHINAFQITAQDRATKYARFSFDASVWEIFPYLQCGAALHIIDESIRLDLPRLNRYFEKNEITISFLPTQVCELFLELDNKSLRYLLTGGDRLRRLRPQNYRVINNYGPTENTVVATSCELGAGAETIPIGKPLFNTRVYLLGKANKLVPIGVPGELCIAGVGLARAYVNDVDKTNEKFVANPFEPGARMYRTGDLAKWLPDGNIEFIGRTDKQVKIRGCRTEPREIEATILAHEAVKDAVVVAREDKQNNKFLCAYIVWREAERFAELRPYLAKQLPDYMVPAFLVTVPSIPLNARGKVDMGALPQPDGSMPSGQSYVAARNDTERRLAEIWSRVLDREKIGVYDNFFEIGGHSLRATIMLAKANKEFSADLALGLVFDNPSIASLAKCFDAVAQHEATVLEPAKSSLYYPTTSTQKMLYWVCTSRKGVEYNLPMAFKLSGDLNISRLESVFRQLIRRHEGLRTQFQMVGGQLMQTVLPTIDFSIDILQQCDEREINEVARDFIRPFDLSIAPLMRVALVPMGSGHHVLLMDIHHLVSDGTSMGILFQEMAALYAGEEPPVPGATFKDFTEWLGGHLQTKKVREQEKYWLSVLRDPPPNLQLDTDYRRPENFSFKGGRIVFKAGPVVHAALKTLCAQRGVTLYMVLLAAYNVLLSKYGRSEDIIVAVPTSGRYIADIQDVVGMFVSTHAIRSRPQAELRFDDFLQQVKTGVRGALEHQEYQLWDILLSYAIQTGGKSLFSTVFVVQDQAFTAMEMPGLHVEEMDVSYHVSKFDLTVGAVEKAADIEFELEYSTDVFKRSTAKRLAMHYANILEQIVADPSKELRQIDLMTSAEKEQVLRTFNCNAVKYAASGNVVQLFERQADESPDRLAVICGRAIITYRELNQRANQLAHGLRSMGIEAGDIVGIMAPPSFETIAGILAVLKAGAAYVPISKDFPQKRIAHLLANSGAKVLLCDSPVDGSLFKTALVDLGDEKNYELDGSNLDLPVDLGALAYVSYVADQMGALKGVMIEHGALLDRFQWFANRFALTAGDRSAKYGDLSTSATIFELFPFLCAGASIYVLPENIAHNAGPLNKCLENNGATIAWLPAPLCERLASVENTALRVLITSGGNVSAARRGAYELMRCSGPAENAEITTCCAVQSDGMSATIGKPISNSEIYIIGHDGGLQPVGVTGELCVAGAGLARGYLVDGNPGDDEAADDKADDRFTSNPHMDGGRMYCTQDSARWLSDGQIEMTGRAGEVSIDGHRVCLAEIERRLESHPGIKEAAVVFDNKDPLRQRVIAFLVLRDSLPVPPSSFVPELKLHLGEWLPEFMVPDTYMKVDIIPRGTDGRVQYDSLPLPEQPTGDDETAVPESATTMKVTSIVENLFDGRRVNPAANLLDLGMDSVMAMSLVAKINDEFGVAPDICQVWKTPTISGISRGLSEGLSGNVQSFAPVEQESRLS